MKYTKSLIACALLSLVAGAHAGTTYVDSKYVAPPAPEPMCFGANEFSFDIFATYQTTTSDGYYGDGFGGGIGVNYFVSRYFGFGADVFWSDHSESNSIVHSTSASLILRAPIDSICLAPYVFGGGGYHMDSQKDGSLHAGLGLEYRINENVGLFTDGRHTWTEDNDFLVFRTGLRFAF